MGVLVWLLAAALVLHIRAVSLEHASLPPSKAAADCVSDAGAVHRSLWWVGALWGLCRCGWVQQGGRRALLSTHLVPPWI